MSFITQIGQVVGRVGDVLKETYGPLAKLNPKNDLTGDGIFRYPLDVGNPGLYPHTVEFHFYQPIPVGTKKPTTKSPTKSDAINLSGDSPYLKSIEQETGGLKFNRNLAAKDQVRIVDWKRRSELKNIVAMYTPRQGPQDTFNVDYSDMSITAAAGGLGFWVEAGSSMAAAWDSNIDVSATPFLVEAAKSLAGNLVGDANVLGEVGLQVAGGYATNPQLEVMFNGPQFRKFMFQFKLLPRSRKEADEMIKIIKCFKYHSSPEYLQTGGRFWIPPSYVDVYFNYNGVENKRMPMKISTCVITALDLDMGSSTDQFVSYSDGTPLEIGLQLQLTELEVMHKELRLQGY